MYVCPESEKEDDVWLEMDCKLHVRPGCQDKVMEKCKS